MGIAETIGVALRNLWANKLRTALSVLGIVIGVASVITMISAGSSAQKQITSDISALGSNMIMVTPNLKPGAQGRSYQHLLTMSLADQIQAAAPAISAVSPVAQIEGRIIAGGFSAPSVITGITPAYTRIVNTRIALGRSLIQSEVDAAAHSIVLGSEAASDLFGSEDPIGRHVALVSGDHRAVFTVVGVTESKGALFWANSDTQAFIPVTTLLYRMSPFKRVGTYFCQASSAQAAEVAVAQVERFLASVAGTPDAFSVASQASLIDAIKQVTATMTLLLGTIAGISLVVGGIGIMNTLLTSVAERTREIGVRKSLGACNRDILLQFLSEALVLSMLGGTVGMLLGWLGGAGIARIAGWPISVDLSSVVAAVSFSTAVGLIFGTYPALQASRMDPVQALRYE
ncbi:MAG: ABC transporter permease [Bacillota bacterium]|jgi:putative ABC transport system permease protein